MGSVTVKGGPLRLHLREGQCSGFTGADVLRKDLPPVATVMGDQGYDRDKIRKMLAQQGITSCIPPRCCGIIHVIQKGLRWVDTPAAAGSHKTLYNRCHRW